MNPVSFQLRVMQFAFIASVVMFFFVGQTLIPATPSINATFQWVIVFIAIGSASMGFVLQRIFLRAANKHASTAQGASALRVWRAGHILRFATAESVALFGLVLQSVGASANIVYALFGGSALLLLLWQPGAVPAETVSRTTVG